jgi:hypothetical protein
VPAAQVVWLLSNTDEAIRKQWEPHVEAFLPVSARASAIVQRRLYKSPCAWLFQVGPIAVEARGGSARVANRGCPSPAAAVRVRRADLARGGA